MDPVIHKKDGLVPHFTFCPRCGDSGAIEMFNAEDYVTTCPSCTVVNYGAGLEGVCNCGAALSEGRTRRLEFDERVPSPALCVRYQELSNREAEVVSQGGVFFRCSECGRGGALLPESGLLIRDKIDLEKFGAKEDGTYPDCGVEFTQCDQHGPFPGER